MKKARYSEEQMVRILHSANGFLAPVTWEGNARLAA